jgi:hypothetical protein
VAEQCFAPPVLENPKVCTLGSSGGSCSFGADEDGIVQFPNQIVNGAVTISGGRNLHVTAGHIRANPGDYYVVAFDHPKNVFVEGVYADANGQCDVFAIRNHNGTQNNFTFQNIYAEGAVYNNPNVQNGNCHGDLIQNQGENTAGGLNLRVENFVGVTSAQGFFIPHRSSGAAMTELRNVYIRMPQPIEHTFPLLWFWSPQYAPNDPAYPVTLNNVNVDWAPTGQQLFAETGTYTADTYDFQQAKIAGVVNKWNPDGTDLDYTSKTGLAYNRAAFCSETAPEPVVETQPAPEPDPAPEPSPDLTQADTVAPSVDFASPTNGGSVQRRSKAIITVNAIDNVAVSDVQLLIEGRRVARFSGPGPHSYEWKAWFRRKGTVTISAQATDTSGNRGRASVSVELTN